MDVNTFLGRAQSALGKRTIYKSPGRMPPLAAVEWSEAAENDCSGFVCWCLRFSQTRRVDHPLYVKANGGWFETTAIHKDGLESTGFFSPLDTAKPGALLVYPDLPTSQGHVGIVTEVSGKGIAGVVKVIHCSRGNFTTTQDAVQVTGAQPWKARKDSLILWYEGMS